MGSSTKIRKQAQKLQGRPVCITLHNGRSYVGWITGLEKEALILSRPSRPASRRQTYKKTSPRKKAGVSGFFPIFDPFTGPPNAASIATAAEAGTEAATAAGGGFGQMGLFGMIQRTMPLMKTGYNMIKTIQPFLGELKSFMK
ncbi:hypothetical protein [Paenibacillus sp. GCM10012306]|uniref:hypothetical protein n=1 Tax=Paenibacillus sp. GCM10012306 TaxID=3317342 RepID=UPI00360861FA